MNLRLVFVAISCLLAVVSSFASVASAEDIQRVKSVEETVVRRAERSPSYAVPEEDIIVRSANPEKKDDEKSPPSVQNRLGCRRPGKCRG